MEYTLTLNEQTLFEDAVAELDRGGIGYLAILDKQGKLLGIMTDGDIRRAILNKKKNILEVINTHPQTTDYRVPRRQVIHNLKEIHRKHMPLVDENRFYRGVVALDTIEFNAKPNKVVIMAGGLGSRLGTLTENLPKPMLRVGKKSILENLIDIFADHGFTQFYISVNYKSEIIKDYFGNGKEFGVNIQYLEEKQRLGTGGCLSLIDERLEHPFFVINGDVLTAMNFEELLEFHNSSNVDGTMCVREYEVQIPYGVVNYEDNRVVSMSEKPVHRFHVNSGIYLLNPDILKLVPKESFFNMTDLLDLMIEQDMKVASYELNDYWIDVGQPKDLEKAQKDFSGRS